MSKPGALYLDKRSRHNSAAMDEQTTPGGGDAYTLATLAAAYRGLTGDWIYAGYTKTLSGIQPDPSFLF